MIYPATNIAGMFLRVAGRGHYENVATFLTALGAPDRAPNIGRVPALATLQPLLYAYRIASRMCLFGCLGISWSITCFCHFPRIIP